MENTTTLSTYFANVLANEDLDLLHDDIWLASSSLEQVPAGFALFESGNANEDDLTDLGSTLNSLASVFNLINEYAPNNELAAFVASLRNVALDPNKAGPTFLTDFSRIVDAYLQEGSKILYT
jgi:hypothetical protein